MSIETAEECNSNTCASPADIILLLGYQINLLQILHRGRLSLKEIIYQPSTPDNELHCALHLDGRKISIDALSNDNELLLRIGKGEVVLIVGNTKMDILKSIDSALREAFLIDKEPQIQSKPLVVDDVTLSTVPLPSNVPVLKMEPVFG